MTRILSCRWLLIQTYLAYLTAVRSSSGLDSEMAIFLSVTFGKKYSQIIMSQYFRLHGYDAQSSDRELKESWVSSLKIWARKIESSRQVWTKQTDKQTNEQMNRKYNFLSPCWSQKINRNKLPRCWWGGEPGRMRSWPGIGLSVASL